MRSPASEHAPEVAAHHGPRRSRRLALAGLAVMAIPLVVALVTQLRHRWVPILDQAMMEMILRDVGTSHNPLTGLVGRFSVDGQQADHPGPLAFYLAWPLYRVFGASAAAVTAATVVLHAAAMATIVWLAHRRRHVEVMLVVVLAAIVLARAYGGVVLTYIWNPHVPLLWWLAFLLAAWALACGDFLMLPVLAAIGSLCVQSHVPYLGPVGGVGVVAFVVAAVGVARHPDQRGALLRWTGAALLVVAVLWAPVAYEEVTNEPGNLTLLWRYFFDEAEASIGWAEGGGMLLRHLDPTKLVSGQLYGDLQSDLPGVPDGPVGPGVAVLVAWLATAVTAVGLHRRAGRRTGPCHGPLLRLHLVVAGALAASFVSLGRIVPPSWYWVQLWAWSVAGLLWISVLLTAVAALNDLPGRERAARVGRRLREGLVAALLLVGLVFTVESTRITPFGEEQPTAITTRLIDPTAEALASGEVPGGGREGTYLLTTQDPATFGIGGFGLVNELERRGFEVGQPASLAPQVREHRVVSVSEATAELRLVGGVFIARTAAIPGAVQVARADLRTPAERREHDRISAELLELIEAMGREDLRTLLYENQFPLAEALDGRGRLLAQRLFELGEAQAVFVVPVGAEAPPAG